MSDGGGNRSQPRNLQGVLQLAVENTTHSSGAAADSAQPMTDERRVFLQGALNAMGGPGPVERIQTVLRNTADYLSRGDSSDDNDEQLDTLLNEIDEMIDWCEYIDVACDFHKLGGYTIFSLLQNSSLAEFRWRCGEIIAALCQNNPYCQLKMIEETEQLDILMKIVEDNSENHTVRVKAMLGLSGLLRGNDVGQKQFVTKDGHSLLLRAMQSEDPKLRTKATFLMKGILSENDIHKEELTKMGCVEQLLTMVNTEHEQHHEHIMATLMELLQDYPPAISDASKLELHLQPFLKSRIQLLENQPEYQEELEYCQQIENLVFGDSDNLVDR